jgi:hypothetical protein
MATIKIISSSTVSQVRDMSDFIPGTYHAELDTTPKPNSAPTHTKRMARRTASGRIIRTGFRTNVPSLDFSCAENRTTLSVTIRRKYTQEEKATAARERSRQEAADYTHDIPEHKKIFADIGASGEAMEGLTQFLSGTPDNMHGWKYAGASNLTRQLIEDCHVSGAGDVLRNTGIDRDPRPKHFRPTVICRDWKVDGATAERITAALKMLSADAAVARHYRDAFRADSAALVELEILAGQLAAEELPEDDVLSTAARYYEDSDAGDEEEIETVDCLGFTQFVNLDDVRDEDYHQVAYVNGEQVRTVNTASPACPWSLKQPVHVQRIGKALRTAATPEALKVACASLVEAKVSQVQGKVLWGIYFRTKERLHIQKFGQPSTKAMKFKARLKGPTGAAPVNFAAAAVAIHRLGPGDRNYLIPALYKAQRQHNAQAARP